MMYPLQPVPVDPLRVFNRAQTLHATRCILVYNIYVKVLTIILFSMFNLLWPVNVIPMCLSTKCKNFLCDSHNFPVLFTAPVWRKKNK